MGKLKVEMEGEEPLELDMKLRDKHRIMTHMKDFAGNPTEEQIESLFNVFLDILKRSYPESDEERIERIFDSEIRAVHEWNIHSIRMDYKGRP